MYEDFYNLTSKPFNLSPDPDFFYDSQGHSRAMAYLEYGVDQAEGFIVITGDVGAGKTTLVSNLFRRLDPSEVIAAQLVSTQLEANDMLRSVGRAFGLEPQATKSDLLSSLEGYLRQCRRDGKRCLLVVDEAQNLDDTAVEELRMLSNFQTESGSLLQSFLVGQPEFRETLRSPSMQQLRQRVIATYHLGPLQRNETRDYIEHRLGQVGWRHDPAFTEGAYDALHAYTAGVPRQINTVCDRLLLMAFLEERHWIDEDIVAAVTQELDSDFGAAATASVDAGAGRSDIGAPGLGDADYQAVNEERLEGIEGRLVRLERQLIHNASVLRQILDCLRRGR